VKKQRPDSGLDEDAKEAAELWNKAVDESEETSSEEEEEEEEWAVREVLHYAAIFCVAVFAVLPYLKKVDGLT